jgi:hypothetical protein
METLIEKLYNNNVIFSYYGFIDTTVLKQVLEITNSKLRSFKESDIVVERVHDAINDCVANIISHNFYPDDERLHYKSLLIVSLQNEDYFIDTLNVVNDSQKKVIDNQLHYLDSKERTELEEIIEQHANENMEVNSAIIKMMLKADRYDCTFKKLNSNYLFNINFRISTAPVAVSADN